MAIDLTGRIFGRLAALEPAVCGGAGNRRGWLCSCSCGGTVVVVTSNLTRGNTLSCGCLQREAAAAAARIDISGRRFGRLVALEAAPKDAKDRVLWRCACDCGGIKLARVDSLTTGNTTSCGCFRAERIAAANRVDITGHTFGKLTALRSVGTTPAGSVIWECACTCGGTTHQTVARLRTGHVASCGCAILLRETVRPEQVRKREGARTAERYRNNVKFALECKMRSRLHQSLKAKRVQKGGRFTDLMGYTMQQLADHLQRTIPPGFTWADFLAGRLEIEHIIPLSVFNYERTSDHDFHRAWALKNLRLLPMPENREKSDKLMKPFQPALAF